MYLPVQDEIYEQLNEEGEEEGSKKVAEKKIKIVEKLLQEWLKSKKVNFYSMLGAYSDKKNLDQLHSFEEDEGEEIKLMLVINKLTEGNHVKGISGVILLRKLGEDSIILLQQIMGRGIFAIDEENPLEEDEIPIIIDIPNNIINANWEKVVNTYTVKDDEELLRDIIDWIERHGEKLPDIESTGREEYRKAVTLKRIQEKYIKYLEEERKEEITEKIQRIIELGEEIDLWNEILPDKLDKDGQVIPIEKLIHINVFHAEEKIGRLVEILYKLSEEVENTERKTVYEQVIEFLENHNGKIVRGRIYKDGKGLKVEEMTEEQKEEVNLYQRWKRSKEKGILDQYAGESIEKVPREYKEKIAKLREYGLGKKDKRKKQKTEKTVYEQVIEFLESHNGKIMRGSFRNDGKILKAEEMTEEQKEEVNLYQRWYHSKEMKLLDQYAGKSIEKVPREYREKIAKLREYGLGKKEKTVYEQVIEFLEAHDGKLMISKIRKDGKVLKVEEMTEEQNKEVKLYSRWKNTEEKEILDQYAGEPIEKVPEEYREKIAKLREYGLGKKKKKIKGQELGQTTFTAGEEGIKQCDGAGKVLSEAIKGHNKDEVILNNGDE